MKFCGILSQLYHSAVFIINFEHTQFIIDFVFASGVDFDYDVLA